MSGMRNSWTVNGKTIKSKMRFEKNSIFKTSLIKMTLGTNRHANILREDRKRQNMVSLFSERPTALDARCYCLQS